jgi:hypothetical protein
VLWIISVVCLFNAIGHAVTAEESLNNPNLTAADHSSIQQESQVADRLAVVGWVLQLATTIVLSFGIRSPRAVRRVFISLGVLIAVDGVSLLLMAVIIHI